jgi:hypothetical protein
MRTLGSVSTKSGILIRRLRHSRIAVPPPHGPSKLMSCAALRSRRRSATHQRSTISFLFCVTTSAHGTLICAHRSFSWGLFAGVMLVFGWGQRLVNRYKAYDSGARTAPALQRLPTTELSANGSDTAANNTEKNRRLCSLLQMRPNTGFCR